jgi:fructose-1-phosphate kinase PfkB-like protein
MMDARDICDELGVSRSKAYAFIHKLNEELRKAGYFVISGKVPRDYYEKRFYFGS